MNETISIVVPIYNLEDYIRDCVDSILVQTYGSLEVILVDDGSTDSSAEICQDYAKKDARVKYIRVEPNRGVVHARKEGIMAATGKYIGFVDGDDWIEPTMYEELIRNAEGVDLVSCGIFKYFSKSTRRLLINDFPEGVCELVKGCEVYRRGLYDLEKSCRYSLISGLCNKLFLLEPMKLVCAEIEEGIVYAEDLLVLYKYLLKSKKLFFLHKGLYHYRFRQTSACNKKNDRFLENINRVYCLLEEEFYKNENREFLIVQLQKWLEALVCEGINKHMGLSQDIYIPRYLIDTEEFIDKKIVLYGAGQAGKDYYWQLRERGSKVVLWVDNDAERYQTENLPVVMPQEIERTEYDVVLIGVKDREVAEKIRMELKTVIKDISCAIWREPISVY